MDKNHLVSKLNKILPGAVLESRRFGRSGITSIWVEAQSICSIGLALKEDSEVRLDWLENLSVVEFEKVLVVSYFVRSYSTDQNLVIRASAVPTSNSAEVLFPSVRMIWPMAEPMEKEAFEMFGVRFQLDGEKDKNLDETRILPEDWKGFPLRKSYVFPKEYFGIAHVRPFNRLSQKKTSQ